MNMFATYNMKKQLLTFLCFIVYVSNISFLYAQSPAFSKPQKLRYPQLNFKPLHAERVVLTNGMILYILEDHELPLVNMYAVIRTGSYFDPNGKEGLAELTGTVMRTGGTETTSGSAIDEALESFAININISAQIESTSISYSSLKNNVDKGFDILSQVMMHPVFAKDKVMLAKNLKTEELKRIRDDPQQFAFREFNRVLYREDPRGRLPTIRSVGNITRDDLIQFHQRFFSPDQTMVAVTGDISKSEAIKLLERYFGSWHNKTIREEISPPIIKLGGEIYHIQKDLPQSIVITGKLAPAKATTDFYPFTVLDFILGSGGFPSRIFQQIRTDQGLAYSAGSFYRARSDYGVFGTYAMTKSESTGKVLSLLHTIMEKTTKEPVTSKELTWAKNSINSSFIFSFSSMDQIARQQLMLEFDKMPSDYLISYPKLIKKVTIKDITRVAKTYFSTNNTITLVLGRENTLAQLPSLIGKVETLQIEDD